MIPIRLGIAKIAITPQSSIPLAGFAHREGPSHGVARPIYVRAWLFEQAADSGEISKALFIQGDLIWWPSERMARMKQQLSAAWNIAVDCIVFHASHTHSGPQTSDRFNELLGALEPAYVDYVEQQVAQAVSDAHDAAEEVRIEKGVGQCEGIGINRRLLENGTIRMKPNPQGVNDTELTVFRFLTKQQQVKGILFHYTCHPTTTDANQISSEYCGAAMEWLDDRYGDGVSCFLQGFCGDIRPSLIRGSEFYRGDDREVSENGEKLAKAVDEILQLPLKPIVPSIIEGWTELIELPFQRLPTAEQLQQYDGDDDVLAAWKRHLLQRNDKLLPGVQLQLHLLKIADGFALFAVDGEIVVEYGLSIKQWSHGEALPLGYSNGMVCYIPTAQQIREGGYESNDSMLLFGYPSPFHEQIEIRILTGIGNLLANLNMRKVNN